jgi:hypothetical protein
MAPRSHRTFWDRVAEAMRDLGMSPTQTAAAKLIGIKQPSVSDWTKPGGYPTMENGVRLAGKLGVCVEWLFTENGPKRPPPRDMAAERLWDLWGRLDDSTRGEMVGLAVGRVGPPREDGHPRPKRA